MARTDDPAQRLLPLTREERLALIDGVDPASIELGKRAWRNVHALLKQLEFCSTAGDSYVRVEVLMAKMKVDRRTVQRARAAAEGAGLLEIASRTSHNGQASNQWRINWGRVIAAQEPGARAAAHGRQTAAPPRQTAAPPRQTAAPIRNTRASYRLLGPISIRSTGAAAPATGGDQKYAMATDPTRGVGSVVIDVAATRGVAATIERKLGGRRSARDWELACKAAVLMRVLGENWLWDSVAAVERRIPPADVPWGFFHRCLDEKAAELGAKFNRALSLVVLPVELLEADVSVEREFSERLCVARED